MGPPPRYQIGDDLMVPAPAVGHHGPVPRQGIAPITANVLARPVGTTSQVLRLKRLLSGQSRHVIATYLTRNVDASGTLTADPKAADVARGVSSAALGLAIGVRANGFDATLPVGTAKTWAIRAISAAATTHLTVTASGWGGSGGNHPLVNWQTPLSSGQLGMAAWLLWGELNPTTRDRVVRAVVHEADFLESQGIHYLRDIDANVLTPGDTGAESESWRCRGLGVALAMKPGDANALRWHRSLVARQLAAYARHVDVRNAGTLIHGAPLDAWLGGSNMEANGDLINHLIINPNYMRPVHHINAAAALRLAGHPVSPSVWWNLDVLWNALRARMLPTGGYNVPVDVPARNAILYVNDVQHRALGGYADATRWEDIHGQIAEDGMAASSDGRVADGGQPGSFTEADLLSKLGEAYLTSVLGPRSSYGVDRTLVGAPTKYQPAPVRPRLGPAFPDVAGEQGLAASWNHYHGLVTARHDGLFHPGDPITRLEAVRALWRASGSPTGYAAHGFSDVPSDGSQQDLPVRYAKSNGITVGQTPTTFNPNAQITRGQAVLFLWRERGKPDAGPSGFQDVTGEVARAADWAKLVGVTRGETASTFAPARLITRGQWVTMVYRERKTG